MNIKNFVIFSARAKNFLKGKSLRIYFKFSLSLGIVFFLGYFIFDHKNNFIHLINISISQLLLLILLDSFFPIINGIQNTLLYRSLGLNNFTFLDGYLITATSTLANQLPIPGGILSKGYYLKNRHNLSITKFTSSTIATFLCYLAVSGLIGFCILFYWNIVDKKTIPFFLHFLFIAMSISITFFWIPIENIKIPKIITAWSQHITEGWMVLGKNPKLLLSLIVLQTFLLFLLAFRYFLVFQMLSQNITFSQCMLFACASILTQIVSVAPGGLGIRETIVATIAGTLGIDLAISVVCVGIDRLINTVLIIIFGGISYLILSKQEQNSSN